MATARVVRVVVCYPLPKFTCLFAWSTPNRKLLPISNVFLARVETDENFRSPPRNRYMGVHNSSRTLFVNESALRRGGKMNGRNENPTSLTRLEVLPRVPSILLHDPDQDHAR